MSYSVERVTASVMGILVVGYSLGVFSIIALDWRPHSKVSRYDAAVEECQKSLPRDQFCKVIAVPVEKVKD